MSRGRFLNQAIDVGKPQMSPLDTPGGGGIIGWR